MTVIKIDSNPENTIPDVDRKALNHVFELLAERGRKLRRLKNEKVKTADDFDLGQIASSAVVNSDSGEPELLNSTIGDHNP